MISLIFTICSLANPYQCIEKIIPLTADNIIQCEKFGQVEVANWFAEHPEIKMSNYVFRGYKCKQEGH